MQLIEHWSDMAKSALHNDLSGGCILNSWQDVNMAIIVLTNMNFTVHYLQTFQWSNNENSFILTKHPLSTRNNIRGH